MRTRSPARLAEARRTLERSEGSAGRNSEPASPAASLSEEGLTLGPGLHEWLADDADGVAVPPLGVLIDLARRHSVGGRSVLWIGRRCWPHPHALALRGSEVAGDALLRRSVFVDPPSRAELIWSADAALRRSAVVIADGAGLAMAESRRLQLAAKDAGELALVARPRRDRIRISAARTRWLVTPSASESLEQTWTVELLRCKGVQPEIEGARRWLAQRDHATGAITSWRACDERVASDVDGRRPQPASPPSRARIA